MSSPSISRTRIRFRSIGACATPGIKFPDGLTYVGSWIEPNFDRCFQLMESDDARLLQEWVLANNRDLGMTFEIVPVIPSKETREVVAPYLDRDENAATGP